MATPSSRAGRHPSTRYGSEAPDVDRATFQARLRVAAEEAVEFARRYVREELPDDAVFRVYPNQSFDEHPRVGDEVVFPADSLPEGAYHGPWSVAEVIRFLWRDGKVPEWIDIAVEDVVGGHTTVSLLCCGRFTARDDLLYHRDGGRPPFAVKSPVLPPGGDGSGSGTKFTLRWRDDQSGAN